jgi:hypothetical protein
VLLYIDGFVRRCGWRVGAGRGSWWEVGGGGVSELRRRSALEEMIQQNATQKLFRQEFLKGTYDLMKVL